jgi:hypothetical protein
MPDVAVNMPPDWVEAVEMAQALDGQCVTLQVLVPVPRLIVEDRSYDLGGEIYEQVRLEIAHEIDRYRVAHGVGTPVPTSRPKVKRHV